MKFCVVAGLQEVVVRFEFYQNRLSGFGAVGDRNLPFPIDLADSSETAKPILMKFEPQNYRLKNIHHAKFHFDPTTWIVSANTHHD